MATSKPISTISYNSTPFLIERLDELVCSGAVAAWFFIKHYGEMGEDEACGKEHIHLLLVPNRCVDMMKVAATFIEFDPASPGKPLKCLPFRPSKLTDWFLYAVHDPDYLQSHCMEREYVYDVADIKTNDTDYLNQMWVEARQSLRSNPVYRMKQAVNSGVSFRSMVNSGAFSIQQIRNAELFYSYLNSSDAEEAGAIVFDDGLLILPNGDIKDPREDL